MEAVELKKVLTLVPELLEQEKLNWGAGKNEEASCGIQLPAVESGYATSVNYFYI